MAELFAEDPSLAAEYLNDILEEGNQADLLVALRQMAQTSGGVAEIARKARVNQTQLYRTLSRHGNPELKGLSAILRALGMRLSVSPLSQEPRR